MISRYIVVASVYFFYYNRKGVDVDGDIANILLTPS